MMSDRAQACFAKFQENVARAARIEEKLPDDKAWSCVVRFYAALHLVNAYMIDKAALLWRGAVGGGVASHAWTVT